LPFFLPGNFFIPVYDIKENSQEENAKKAGWQGNNTGRLMSLLTTRKKELRGLRK